MRHLFLEGAALTALIVIAASGQATDTRYLTTPTLPTDKQLGSLGLRKLWHSHVPTANARDHLVKVHVFGDLVVAETAGGGLAGIDAETGRTLWQHRFPGVSTGAGLFPGANQHHVLVVADNKLIALDRQTGSMDWSVYVPNVPCANITADEQHAYYSAANGEIVSFAIPLPRAQLFAVRAGTLQSETVVSKPQWAWGMRLMSSLDRPPILMNDRLIVPSNDRSVMNLFHDKGNAAEPMPALGLLSAPVSFAGNDLYFSTGEGKVLAIELTRDGPMQRWSYTSEANSRQKPLVTASDLFSVNEEGGLVCLDRQTGTVRWKQRQIKQLVSANLRALLAMDLQGNLRAFDRNYGVQLGSWNAQDYRLPVCNEQTDRVFLANHDGLLVAMRDVSPQHDTPIVHVPPRVKAALPVEVVTEATEVKRLSKPATKQENGSDSAKKSEEKKEN
jgi:hypothetical protein